MSDVVEAWQPATELEARMRDALRDGDQQSYFRLLGEADLVIPLAPELAEEVLANQAQPTWPTHEADGRLHVLAYTSPEAMRGRLGTDVQHFMKLTFEDIAESWPEPGWWLLVDPGLPIQGLLPSWFVKQVAEGDALPPQAGPTGTGIPDIPVPDRDETASEPAAPEPAGATTATAEVAEAADGADENAPEAADDAPDEAPAEASGEASEEPPPEGGLQPANDVERDLLRARADEDEDAFLKTLVESEVLIRVPVDTDQALRPGRPDFPWHTAEVEGETSIAVFTSPERMVEILGEQADQGDTATDFMKFPLASIIRYWPERAWTLAVDAGTPIGAALAGERLPGLAEWADQMVAQRMAEHFAPQNEVEQQLFDAALRRDIDEFFAILLGAQVLVPADPETPWGIRPDDPDFPWRPVPVQGELSIQMFTSLKWMHDAIGPSRFVMPTFLDVVSAWPDLAWTLILNPATPVDAAVPGERVRELAAGPGTTPRPTPGEQPTPAPYPDLAAAPVPAAGADPRPVPVPAGGAGPLDPRSLPEFQPGNGTDQELYETAVNGDTDAFLRVLLRASVLVPIPADAPPDRTPVEPRFRWDAAMRDPSSVQVFTSHDRLLDALGEVSGPDRASAAAAARFVAVDFRELIGCWPHAEWTMLVNPGTRIGASLSGDQVQALSAWAVRVGLVPHGAAAGAPPQPWAQPAHPQAMPQPLPPQSLPQQPIPAPPVFTQPAPAPVHSPAAERFPAAAPPEPAGPIKVMQKALPHNHVGWYLDQGYDRIGGFVHAAVDVTELQTPRQLYEALGMLHPGSPFSPDDEGVHVIRWPAYCGDLYRIPFGGQTDEDLLRWGDAGWVVENPPFQGDGFAPGSAGTIREYKVDSIRLPYGAEMYYLGRDRSERFVAVYDPDRLTWLRPEEGTQPVPREQSGVAP